MFHFIQANRANHPIQMMCKVLGVSRSGYYAWLGRPPSRRERENGKLLKVIREIHADSRGVYGSMRVYQALLRLGVRCGRHRVARLMRQDSLQGVPRRKFKRTTRKMPGRPVALDRVRRDFTATAPNRKWATDITYIATREGWLYLLTIMDLYSRRIVGWSMKARMTDDLAIEALDMAMKRRLVTAGLIVHSDHGGQYTSAKVQSLLRAKQALASMGTVGDGYDNAVMESFFSTLKRELASFGVYSSRNKARQAIFEYVEVFYNRQRLHSTLGYLSPAEFEDRNAP